jgi:hypothetical protein
MLVQFIAFSSQLLAIEGVSVMAFRSFCWHQNRNYDGLQRDLIGVLRSKTLRSVRAPNLYLFSEDNGGGLNHLSMPQEVSREKSHRSQSLVIDLKFRVVVTIRIR